MLATAPTSDSKPSPILPTQHPVSQISVISAILNVPPRPAVVLCLPLAVLKIEFANCVRA